MDQKLDLARRAHRNKFVFVVMRVDRDRRPFVLLTGKIIAGL
jgi:hypothetical protein